MAPDRQRLARWISGAEHPSDEGAVAGELEATLSLAKDEGVVALLEDRWRTQRPAFLSGAVGETWLPALKAAARTEMLQSMRMEAEYRRILGLLDATGVPLLLLKGSALAYWAYPAPHLRECGDLDILVPTREAALKVTESLSGAGFRSQGTPGSLTSSAFTYVGGASDGWSMEVDVHWQLNHSVLFAGTFQFDELMAASVALIGLAPGARGLGPVHALLHAAIHRARNLENGVGDRLKWLYDFVVLTRSFSASDWEALLALAEQKGVAGLTRDALAATQTLFAVDMPAEVLDRLGALSEREALDPDRLGDWRYMQRQAWKALPDRGARWRWIRERLFPDGNYLRQVYAMDAVYPVLWLERWRRFLRKWRSSRPRR